MKVAGEFRCASPGGLGKQSSRAPPCSCSTTTPCPLFDCFSVSTSRSTRSTPDATSPASFRHLGSLMRAYQLIGYDIRPESRDPPRTEKGRSRGYDPRSAVKWTEG